MVHLEGRIWDTPSIFQNIGLVEYLRLDRRPTFVLDLTTAREGSTAELVFKNDVLVKSHRLFELIRRILDRELHPKDHDGSATAFSIWLNANLSQNDIPFSGLTWSSTIVFDRWKIISGSHISRCSHDVEETHGERVKAIHEHVEAGVSNEPRLSLEMPLRGSFRPLWTLKMKLSQHNLMVLNFDWSTTPVGPIQTWDPILCHQVRYMLDSQQSACLLWGPERIMVYNEPYSETIKAYHPRALGSSCKGIFDVYEEQFEPIYLKVEAQGAFKIENTKVLMDRSGFLEETYFTFEHTAIWIDGHFRGIDARGIEVTRQIVAEDRMLSLLRIGETISPAKSLGDFWHGLAQGVSNNVSNFPIFALYSLDESQVLGNTGVNNKTWFLRGAVGFPPGHSSTPTSLEIDSSTGFAPAFREVLADSAQTVLSTRDSSLTSDLLHNCDYRDLERECHQVVVCPLYSPSRIIIGLLVLGINPLRPYNDEYRTFIQLLLRQIETSLSPVISLAKEKLQSQLLAEKAVLQQQILTLQLEERTREAEQSELRFLKFAEQAPLGIYIIDSDGHVKFANQAWYKLAAFSANYKGSYGWRLNVHPDDKERVDEQWEQLLNGYTQVNFEWRAVQRVPGKADEIRYLRSSCFPQLSADGKMQSVTGVLMDLSLERAQQNAQTERLKDALEAKRAQEYFMDMVSHEIRNPLHAILQLAEEISSSLTAMKPIPHEASDQVGVCIEAIDTIIYCGHHQKQILDDVLTLSKLNSDMLTLSLTETAPISIASKVLKVFESDIRVSKIEASLDLKGNLPNLENLAILMDSGRVLQVVFNLVGNSIKFMKDRPTRKLNLTVSVSLTRPINPNTRYIPSGKPYSDPTVSCAQSTNKIVYVQYSVEDTGPGMTVEEMNTLFARFKQASPRTHTQYGGSGLGLFISRELVEMHGGEIGLSSCVNEGSTFTFYVKCVIANDQATDLDGTVRPRALESRKKSWQKFSSERQSVTVLIVEDNLINQTVLNRQLRKVGYRTEIAGNGVEALAILKNSTWWLKSDSETVDISIILCDLEMPVMDGMTCVREIRNLQQSGSLHPNIPVIAVTGNARSEQTDEARRAGFDDVVSKPYTTKELVLAIERILSKASRI